MSLDTKLNIPLDSDLFDRLTKKIINLEQENIHLKFQLNQIKNEKMCEFSISREPQIIDIDRISPLLRLSAYCSIEEHDHRYHVICKILNNNVIQFAYYMDKQIIETASLSEMMCILSEMHKNLIN